jgi:hypothetical protein
VTWVRVLELIGNYIKEIDLFASFCQVELGPITEVCKHHTVVIKSHDLGWSVFVFETTFVPGLGELHQASRLFIGLAYSLS